MTANSTLAKIERRIVACESIIFQVTTYSQAPGAYWIPQEFFTRRDQAQRELETLTAQRDRLLAFLEQVHAQLSDVYPESELAQEAAVLLQENGVAV